MPQREPLSPGLLTLAAVIAALPAAWIALAADAIVSGAVGALAGIPWTGLSLSSSFLLQPAQGPAGAMSAAGWSLALLAGPAGTAVLGLTFHFLAEVTGSKAWLRVLALEWSSFALLRLPALLLAGAVPGGRGVVGELYARLGEPQTGRWSVALLALLTLCGAAAIVARRTIATGRDWMRVDGRQFRRRLVRVLGSFPALAALTAWCALAPWAAPVWMAVWLALTLTSLHVFVS